jgi:hypothetical protein
VMVFIHGGAFVAGSNASSVSDGRAYCMQVPRERKPTIGGRGELTPGFAENHNILRTP